MIIVNEKSMKRVIDMACNREYFFKDYKGGISKNMDIKVVKNLLSYEIKYQTSKGNIVQIKLNKFNKNIRAALTATVFAFIFEYIKTDIGSEPLFKKVFQYMKLPYIQESQKMLFTYMYIAMTEMDQDSDLHKIIYEYFKNDIGKDFNYEVCYNKFKSLHDHLHEAQVIL